jgi:alpha-amylase
MLITISSTLLATLLQFPLPARSDPHGSLVTNSPRTVFVQLFEWPWKDIAKECETVLGPQGFSAVQVSPPNEHATYDGAPWWERYQPVSYQLKSRGGDESDFRDMILRCARSGVDVYVDTVINHMTGIGVDEGGVGQAGTRFNHYDYPGLYGFDDFHHCGRNRNRPETYDDIIDWTDRYEIQNCEIVNLADLATEKASTQKTISRYLNYLLDLGVGGFRIDAAKHIPSDDLHAILGLLKRSVYVVQELMLDKVEPIKGEEYLQNGDYTVFDYSYDVGRAFRAHELWKLQSVGTSANYPNSQSAVVFIENHDLQRNAWAQSQLISFHTTPTLAKLAHVFMLAWPYGYPQIFSGYDFVHFDDGPPIDRSRINKPVLSADGRCRLPWLCEHRSPEVAPMVQFRNLTNNQFYATDWWANGTQVAFGRGSSGFVVINSGDELLRRTFQTSLSAGVYCDILDISYDAVNMTCAPQGRYTVNSDHSLSLEVQAKSAKAFHFAARQGNQQLFNSVPTRPKTRRNSK